MRKGQLRKSVCPKIVNHGSSRDNVEGLSAYLAQPSVTFHGAPRHVMNSIVRYGVVLLGEEIGNSGKALQVRCGSTFGRGIYSSPDLLYSSWYTQYHDGALELTNSFDVPGMRVVVCTTLMGRALQVSRDTARGSEALLHGDGHPHVSPCKLQYVVFDAAQIIPCYVLHLDFGAEYVKETFNKLVANPTSFFKKRQHAQAKNKWAGPEGYPGDVQRNKEILKAAAAKWFSYGYGPASGTSFVIEDMAEVSDDEEVYGDFQNLRIAEES